MIIRIGATGDVTKIQPIKMGKEEVSYFTKKGENAPFSVLVRKPALIVKTINKRLCLLSSFPTGNIFKNEY